MLFPTLSFAAFFAVVLPVSWLLMPHRVRWRLFMLAASWFFYGAADWRFVPLLAGSTVVNNYFARRIHRASGPVRKTWTVAAVSTNLVVLAWFKYIGFLSLSAQSSLRYLGIHVHVPLPEVLLPIGISFFTFQALSYVIDTSRGKIRPVSLLEFAVYLSFFPHLIAGPIVRATEFLPQIKERIGPRHVDVGKAFWLISMGLFKKVVIASYLATYAADPLFGFPRQHAGVEALFGVYAYAIQIYADFSGYTDIAIGLALLLGIQFPQNFNAPYSAASLQDFWRRWHMTLSRWLRDYLYIPLGGSRAGPRPDLREHHDHHAPRRAVARGGLDVRGVGGAPRHGPDRGALRGERRRAPGARDRARPRAAAGATRPADDFRAAATSVQLRRPFGREPTAARERIAHSPVAADLTSSGLRCRGARKRVTEQPESGALGPADRAGGDRPRAGTGPTSGRGGRREDARRPRPLRVERSESADGTESTVARSPILRDPWGLAFAVWGGSAPPPDGMVSGAATWDSLVLRRAMPEPPSVVPVGPESGSDSPQGTAPPTRANGLSIGKPATSSPPPAPMPVAAIAAERLARSSGGAGGRGRRAGPALAARPALGRPADHLPFGVPGLDLLPGHLVPQRHARS